MLKHIKSGILPMEMCVGRGAHSKSRSFLTLWWLLLSAGSFCIAPPDHTFRIDQEYVDSLDPL